MPTGLSERWLQRLLALVAIVFMAQTLDPEGEHLWLAICFLAIVLVLEFLAFRHGIATGIQMYLNMSPKQKLEVEKMLKEEQ
jgi:preprotein translocase subunit SecG